MNTHTHASAYRKVSWFLFFVLSFLFAGLYIVNEKVYRSIINEDNLVEWLTFGGLLTAGLLSLYIAWQIKSRYHYYHWFFILFFAFNLLAGFEEISWGQRVFDVRSNEFFLQYNDQQETNLHNTFQGVFHVKTKHIALLVLFFYGVVLPWLKEKRIGSRLTDRFQLIVPPTFLRLPFLLGTVLMLDFQTGYEEEIGEFYYSICFVIMMLWNRLLLKGTEAFEPRVIVVPFQPEFLPSASKKKVS